MEEKKHVGRPTNEEVASRKKKKVIKYSLITIVSVLLLGGIALFLNRDNIDFSSLMGASIFKREKYVVNSYVFPFDGGVKGYYEKWLDPSGLADGGYYKCKSSNSKYATCEVFVDELRVYAKKKGNVNLKVYGKNKKGKTVTKTIRIKIGSDFTSPTCKISTAPLAAIKKGTNIEATITCNENVTFTEEGKKYNNTSHFTTHYDSVLKNQKCETSERSYYSYIQRVEKINNKSYKLYYHIPKDACSSNDFRLVAYENTFKDSNGNINYVVFKSNKLTIK